MIFTMVDIVCSRVLPSIPLSHFMVILAMILGWSTVFYRYRRSSRFHYPPGPGYARIPSHNAWLTFTEWGKKYGGLVHVPSVFGHLYIINSSEIATELLDRRATTYSDRPFGVMSALSGWEFILPLLPYSSYWRQCRKTYHQSFRPGVVEGFRPAQYEKVHEYLRNLLQKPEDFMAHNMTVSQAVIFSTMYGLNINAKDHLAKIAEAAMAKVGLTLIPGKFMMVEIFPVLRYLPSWFPGCQFKRVASECRQQLQEMNNIPFDIAIERMKSGTGTSLVGELAAKCKGDDEEIQRIKVMATTSYIAGSDTTMSSISTFILAMTLYPEVQRKAQEELDRVVGTDRLPKYEDRNSLPYIEAIYREVMRWRPAIPLGVMRKTTEDDFYGDYYIPKGSTVVSNIWAMNHDESIYEHPEEFMPERFLHGPHGPFTSINNILAYGFGRRLCVGRYMADTTVWLSIVSVLATLTVAKAKNEDGRDVSVPGEYANEYFWRVFNLSESMRRLNPPLPATPYLSAAQLALVLNMPKC